MPIIGIDYDKCINCQICIKEDRKRFWMDEEQNKVIFKDADGTCSLCGHCIAVCPENAIIYEDMGDESFIFEGIEKLETIIPYNNLYKFLRAHRSIRHYKKEKVPKEILKQVLDIMQYAPTAGNLRYEKFVVLSDREKLMDLSEAITETILNDPAMRAMEGKKIEIKKKYYEIPAFYDAPHVVIVYSLLDIQLTDNNIGNIITYGRLAAQSLGLGTCWNGWIQIAATLNKKVLKLAGVRGKHLGAFTIGYPNIAFKRCPPRSRKPIKGLE